MYFSGREADSKQLKEMLKESPGQLNFTAFLTLFGEKMHGKVSSAVCNPETNCAFHFLRAVSHLDKHASLLHSATAFNHLICASRTPSPFCPSVSPLVINFVLLSVSLSHLHLYLCVIFIYTCTSISAKTPAVF